jgi:transposase
MKISGCFRTLEGARIFVRLRSIVATARKQGANILQTLAASPTQIKSALTA